MNTPEIELLITESINNRPTATKASMSLYIYGGNLICGARIVMPEEATFVAYVPQDRIENGFDENEWKLIVDKIKGLAGSERLEEASEKPQQDNTKHNIDVRNGRLNEKRREPRLRYREPITFGENFDETLLRGQMVDVCSGGVAFTCCCDDKEYYPGQHIVTHFSVPRTNDRNCFETVGFDRAGKICRIDEVNSSLHRVAVQFTEPLPFNPYEQGISEIDVNENLRALTK